MRARLAATTAQEKTGRLFARLGHGISQTAVDTYETSVPRRPRLIASLLPSASVPRQTRLRRPSRQGTAKSVPEAEIRKVSYTTVVRLSAMRPFSPRLRPAVTG